MLVAVKYFALVQHPAIWLLFAGAALIFAFVKFNSRPARFAIGAIALGLCLNTMVMAVNHWSMPVIGVASNTTRANTTWEINPASVRLPALADQGRLARFSIGDLLMYGGALFLLFSILGYAPLRRILANEAGQDVAEYAVMLAVILVIVVGTIKMIGTSANNTFNSVASSLSNSN